MTDKFHNFVIPRLTRNLLKEQEIAGQARNDK